MAANHPISPPDLRGRLLFSIQDVADLYGMKYMQVDRLMRDGAFGDDWESFPNTGKRRRIPRGRVLRWAQVDEAEVFA